MLAVKDIQIISADPWSSRLGTLSQREVLPKSGVKQTCQEHALPELHTADHQPMKMQPRSRLPSALALAGLLHTKQVWKLPAICRTQKRPLEEFAAATCGAVIALLMSGPVNALDGQDAVSAKQLATDLANPVANLISVPFQLNWDTGIGPKDADRATLNIQPVIPFSLNADWNLISRTILPISYLGSTADGVDSAFGLGDTVQSLFFSPKKPVDGLHQGNPGQASIRSLHL